MSFKKVSKELMTIKDVTDFFHINRSTVYDWKRRGILKAYGVGRRVYFKTDEVKSVLTELI